MAQPDILETLRKIQREEPPGEPILCALTTVDAGQIADEIERLRAQLAEAAAFLDALADDLEPHLLADVSAAECRAMATKLRK